MTLDQVTKLCRAQPGASDNIQWGADRVFKIAGKMFCCMGTEPDSKYSFKADPERFLELTDQPGIAPAPYLARAKWVQVDPATCQLADEDLAALIENSWRLVFARLPKKVQREIVPAD